MFLCVNPAIIALKMETVSTSGTSVGIYQTTLRNIPEGSCFSPALIFLSRQYLRKKTNF
jgi:hypothetical protein